MSSGRCRFLRLLPCLALALPALAGAADAVLDPSLMDPQVRPQDDLFRAANGRWLRDTPIAADQSDAGAIRDLRDRSDGRVRRIVEDLAARAAPAGGDAQKVAAYYRSFIDEALLDEAGNAPLASGLAAVDAIRSRTDLAALFGHWQGVVPVPLAVTINPDARRPDLYRAQVWQSGLGLPDRDYYLKPGPRFQAARSAYRTYLETLLRLAGDAGSKPHAGRVLALETRLAKVQWPLEESSDSLRTYNPTALRQLARSAPGLDWGALFEAAALPALQTVSVSQPSYARALAQTVAKASLADWQLYLRARWLDAHAHVLPKAYRDAGFAFHGKALSGRQQPLPRWQQAVAALDTALGEAVGRLYVQQHFPAANKARMQELVAQLMKAYAQSIDSLAWMGPKTKQRAQAKLAKVTTKIGYPERWRDYGGLEVRNGDALGNFERAGRFEHERQARREGQPVDRSEWGMTPQTVNAYYDPSVNEIVFPAAILEPPYFDIDADDASNYGSIGATIGHEISHGFDNDGSRYDGDGKLTDWWTRSDRKAFDALGAQLAAQFNAYQPIAGHRINGRLTLGENIADLSGLEVAFRAYHLALNGKAPPVIDGMSGDQRFFMAYAQSWREKTRDEDTLKQLASDPHAPAEYRANGSVVNADAFHRSFGTRPGDAMFKPGARRIRIW
jgi:putative endopeptidase